MFADLLNIEGSRAVEASVIKPEEVLDGEEELTLKWIQVDVWNKYSYMEYKHTNMVHLLQSLSLRSLVFSNDTLSRYKAILMFNGFYVIYKIMAQDTKVFWEINFIG
ncbi:hypothetical protein HPP92_020678 [Vanilla planifolia]|uniref:Uncharacterized protein n=1 Tax=Vanilla planifolia TaxID=51239 RepID=A0A835UHU0_VANPL|nr:hypothetical protein HPP92_021006 [Vanilla planifolia]KAG0462202.1 hypothetical protein HPP92_020678 [Vanilla planifolia]